MKITADDPRAPLATVRLDGRVVQFAVRADDKAGYVDVVRRVEDQFVLEPDGLGGQQHMIDRLHGRVAISLHHSTRKRLHLHVPSFGRITQSETRP